MKKLIITSYLAGYFIGFVVTIIFFLNFSPAVVFNIFQTLAVAAVSVIAGGYLQFRTQFYTRFENWLVKRLSNLC